MESAAFLKRAGACYIMYICISSKVVYIHIYIDGWKDDVFQSQVFINSAN